MDSTSLLLYCLDFQAKDAANVGIGSVQTKVWNEVLEKSNYHQTSPYLYSQIKARGVPCPDHILAELKSAYRKNVYKNINLYYILGPILKDCDQAHIPVVVLKGAYLAEAVYQDIGLRCMSDIDLLVRPNRFSEMITLLSKETYQRKYFHHAEESEEAMHMAFHSNGKPVIELHRKLNEEYTSSMQFNEIWNRLQSVKIAGQSAFALSNEDLLIYLCIHTIQHLTSVILQMFVDIGKVLTQTERSIDWKLIKNQSEAWGVHRAVFSVLTVGKELLSIPISEEALASLRPDEESDRYINFLKDRLIDYSRYSVTKFSSLKIMLKEGKQVLQVKTELGKKKEKKHLHLVWWLQPRMWAKIFFVILRDTRKIWANQREQSYVEAHYKEIEAKHWFFTGDSPVTVK